MAHDDGCVCLGDPLFAAKLRGRNRGWFTFPCARCSYTEFRSTVAAIQSYLKHPAALKLGGYKYFPSTPATSFLDYSIYEAAIRSDLTHLTITSSSPLGDVIHSLRPLYSTWVMFGSKIDGAFYQ